MWPCGVAVPVLCLCVGGRRECYILFSFVICGAILSAPHVRASRIVPSVRPFGTTGPCACRALPLAVLGIYLFSPRKTPLSSTKSSNNIVIESNRSSPHTSVNGKVNSLVSGHWVSSSESLQPICSTRQIGVSFLVCLTVSRVVPPPHTPTVDAMQRSGDGRCLAHASLSLCVFCVWQLLSHIEKAGSVPGPNSAGWGHSLLKVSDSSRGPPRRLV